MSANPFRKAERRRAKLRLGLCGPSGSGKTHSALLIASGLVPDGRIALIDTERGSAELEAGKPGIPEYDVLQLAPPYTPARYVEAIRAAEQAGYDLVIVDSLSHAWSGEGGVIEIADRAGRSQAAGGNRFAGWRDATPQHNQLVEALIGSSIHVIVTMRTKTAWEIVEDEKGRKKPVKIGLTPQQRDGMEYEFTVVLDLSIEGHIASTSKDRTTLFDGKFDTPSRTTGEALRTWLDAGVEAPVRTAPAATPAPAPSTAATAPCRPSGAPIGGGEYVRRCSLVGISKEAATELAQAVAGRACGWADLAEIELVRCRMQVEAREAWVRWCKSECRLHDITRARRWAEQVLSVGWASPWTDAHRDWLESVAAAGCPDPLPV